MLLWTRLVYRTLARHAAKQVQDYLESGFEVMGIIGVDSSPSCGVQTTINVERAFIQLSRLPQVASTADVNAIVRGTTIDGRGLFVTLLRRELTRRGLHVRFAGHDLLAELDGRKVKSALDALQRASRDGAV
jgi:hypothetical protein